MQRLLSSVLLVGLTGCQWLLGTDSTPAECVQHVDCPDGLGCVAGQCVVGDFRTDTEVGAMSDAAVDMLAAPAPDMAMDAETVSVDAAVDMMPDMAPLDAALPAEIEPVFPDGICFDGAGTVESARGDTLVPRGLCTPYGVLWTRSTDDGAELALSRTIPVEPIVTAPIDPQARLSTTDGRFVAWRGPDETGVFVMDLAARMPEARSIRAIAVSEVVRGAGRTAYVHAGGVFVHLDAEDFVAFVDCSAPGRVQWGVALAEDGVAWFEAPEAGGPAQLVLADRATCRNRIIHPTNGTVRRGDGVIRLGERWVWLARDADGVNQVRGLQPDLRGRLRPFSVPFEQPPLAIAGWGDWLVGIGYAAGAYRIDALHLTENRYRSLSDGASNHRDPQVWRGQLSWAAMVRQRWGVQYVTLDP